MSKLYVFAIGGTGSRVLKSLTMLLASGVRCDSTIVPVIIDPDASNADMTRTVELLNLYNQIRKPSDGDTFFKTEISDETANGWCLPIANTRNRRFKEFIGIDGMDDANRTLCEALFSEKNLEADMSVGFKGNPNIGSVVLNQFTDSDAFKTLCGNFQQGDRIFIISSIFGGTGASGFPLLLKTLREIDNAIINQARIGAITVLPYFNLGHNENSEIDASTFISKTKSALSYYAVNISKNHSLSTLYYIGDNVKKSITNCEGGSGQKNPAHLIDLVSALAVLDFERMTEADFESETIHKEFGMEEIADDKTVTFSTFYDGTNAVIRKRLIQMWLTVKYFDNHFRNEGIKQPWAQKRGIDKFVDSSYFGAFSKFMRRFNDWIKEMESTKRKFSPFKTELSNNTNTDVFETIRDINRTEYGMFAKTKSYLVIDNNLNSEKIDTSSGEYQLLKIFNNATKKAAEQMLNQ